jgi:pyridoxamine 5'-phosphate oxidase family protein
MAHKPPLTNAELAYLATQRLGRLATIQPNGTLQISPVGFRINRALGVLDIGGMNMAASQKFRNIANDDRVSLCVDDIAGVNPWRVRCVEIRGRGEALLEPTQPAIDGPIIRVHPVRIIGWGLSEFAE